RVARKQMGGNRTGARWTRETDPRIRTDRSDRLLIDTTGGTGRSGREKSTYRQAAEQHEELCAGRIHAASAVRSEWRALHRRRWDRPRILGKSRANGGEVRARSV